MDLLLRALVALLLLSPLAGCVTYIPFTNRLRQQHDLNDGQVRELQFYVSEEFSMSRDTTTSDRPATKGGIIRTKSGRLIEEILVRRLTPGEALEVRMTDDHTRLGVSFVPDDNSNSIRFGVDGEDMRDLDAHYRLVADKWENNLGDVTYDGKDWQINDERHPYLLVRKQDINKLKREKKILPGRRVR